MVFMIFFIIHKDISNLLCFPPLAKLSHPIYFDDSTFPFDFKLYHLHSINPSLCLYVGKGTSHIFHTSTITENSDRDIWCQQRQTCLRANYQT